jgi:hypothetical protein
MKTGLAIICAIGLFVAVSIWFHFTFILKDGPVAKGQPEPTEVASVVAVAFVVVASVLIYVGPTVIAFLRSHQNAAAIMALNILLGWTFLGWVAALIWSLTETRQRPGSYSGGGLYRPD